MTCTPISTLVGKKVLVTRPEHQVAELNRLIQATTDLIGLTITVLAACMVHVHE